MNIINQLFEITLSRRSTENIDYSLPAAVAFSIASILFYYFLYSLFEEFSQPLYYAFVLTFSYILAFIVLLKLQNKENRIVQTITALLGVNFILYIIATVLFVSGFLAILAPAVLIYSLVLSVRIIKSAFSCPLYLAIVIFICTQIFSSSMLSIISPQSSQETMTVMENLQQELEARTATPQ